VCAGVALASSWAASVEAKTGFANSRSNQYPRFNAPYSDAPASCREAYMQLDGDRNGRLDGDIISGKRKIDTKAADQCIAEKGWAWAYYLKGRTLAAQLKFDEAARHAEAALAVLKQRGPIPPPVDDIWLFRANALMDAGRPNEARPIYDALIAKHPGDPLLQMLRDSKTWPPEG
jgi:tetratricopeptide (TPR) repeat protein